MENHIQLVKELTEQREKIAIEYQDENNKLKSQLNKLSQKRASYQQQQQQQQQNQISDDEDYSEGFANLCACSFHQKKNFNP